MRDLRRLLVPIIVLCAPGCRAADPGGELHRLFDEVWEFRLAENPLLATSVGDERYNDRLPSVTAQDYDRRAALYQEALDRLERIDRDALGAQDRISHDMFARELRDEIAEVGFRAYQIPFTVDDGFHIRFARLPDQAPLNDVRDYEHYIARLRAYPVYVEQHIANMRDGMARGFTMPRVVLAGYEVTMASHVVNDPTTSVFYHPFHEFPTGVPASEHARLRAAGEAAVREAIVPAYRRSLEFMVREYIPNARESIGAAAWLDGPAYYQHLIRHFTTLDLSPEDIHQLGLREVERIRGEMNAVIREAGFRGSFDQFLRFLRSDPRFYAKTPEELLREAAWIAKRMDGQLPALFRTLPRLPYGVAPVPDHLAPKYTAGRYVSPPIGSTRPGYYWVNTHALESRPLYVLEALSLHEAVPGHHLQISLARELDDIPPFRRFASLSAFSEGWGLYAERLGLEAGFYTDPYSNFGRLTYEMWRACRLVVDTGMHALGWSRRRAMDFLAANTALSLHEIRTETDRYISWPGQALAYKLGELKIRELRRRAEDALGAAFDIRAFHDAVLLNGPVPLPVLEEQIDGFIARATP